MIKSISKGSINDGLVDGVVTSGRSPGRSPRVPRHGASRQTSQLSFSSPPSSSRGPAPHVVAEPLSLVPPDATSPKVDQLVWKILQHFREDGLPTPVRISRALAFLVSLSSAAFLAIDIVFLSVLDVTRATPSQGSNLVFLLSLQPVVLVGALYLMWTRPHLALTCFHGVLLLSVAMQVFMMFAMDPQRALYGFVYGALIPIIAECVYQTLWLSVTYAAIVTVAVFSTVLPLSQVVQRNFGNDEYRQLFTFCFMVTQTAFAGVVVGRLVSAGVRMLVSAGLDAEARVAEAHELADDQRRANLAKTRLVSVMSHDIRNPLTGVTLNTELLLGTSLSPVQVDYARGVERCGKVLLSIVNDVLDATRLESRDVVLDNVPLDLRELCESIIHTLAPKARDKHLEIIFYADPRLNTHARGDATRIRQILFNLIENAIKFTHVGQVTLTLEQAGAAAGGGVGGDEDASDSGSLSWEVEAPTNGGSARAGVGLSSRTNVASSGGGSMRMNPLFRRHKAVGGTTSGDEEADEGSVRPSSRASGHEDAGSDESGDGALDDDGTGRRRRWRFVVEDTGVGMSESNVRRLLSVHDPSSGRYNRAYGGAGLGMFLVTQLSRIMGGTMGIESILDIGSKFSAEVVLDHMPSFDDIALPIMEDLQAEEWNIILAIPNVQVAATLEDYCNRLFSKATYKLEVTDSSRNVVSRLRLLEPEAANTKVKTLVMVDRAILTAELQELLLPGDTYRNGTGRTGSGGGGGRAGVGEKGGRGKKKNGRKGGKGGKGKAGATAAGAAGAAGAAATPEHRVARWSRALRSVLLTYELPASERKVVNSQQWDAVILKPLCLNDLCSGLQRVVGVPAADDAAPAMATPAAREPGPFSRAVAVNESVRRLSALDSLSDVVSGEIEGGIKRKPLTQLTPRDPVTMQEAPLVLLVDDFDLIRHLVRHVLEDLGYQVETACNGEEALNAVKRKHEAYLMVLMDCEMPKMDGFEASRGIREFEAVSNLPPVHICAMTANAMREDMERCLAAGMQKFLAKPVNREVLKEALDEAQLLANEQRALLGGGSGSRGPSPSRSGRGSRRLKPKATVDAIPELSTEESVSFGTSYRR